MFTRYIAGICKKLIASLYIVITIFIYEDGFFETRTCEEKTSDYIYIYLGGTPRLTAPPGL